MNVKAQGLLNAATYIEEAFGRSALAEVLQACSPAVRETYMTAIALNWHPVEELTEFVEVAEAKLGKGRGQLAQEIGAAGARANMKGVLLRFAFYWTKPEYLMRRILGMWRQFNDDGRMMILSIDQAHARLELADIQRPNATFCRIMTGWCTEVAKGLGAKYVSGTHDECRALGASRCIWEVRGKVEAETSDSRPPPGGAE
jgi:hypothetical protein